MDIFFYLGLAVTGFAAGLVGALLGIGGGVFVVPALVLVFHLPTLTAVGTSNVAVVATSTAGASSYVRDRLANVRLALVLLISTTSAALASSLLASYLPTKALSALMALVLVYAGYSMLRGRGVQTTPVAPVFTNGTDLSARLGLEGSYYDAASGATETYMPQRVREGMSISMLAGVIAGLLGVGGGIIHMPVMTLLMRVPIKVATGTSNFMMG